MRKGLIYLLIFILLLVAPTGIRYWHYYDLGQGERATPSAYDPSRIAQVPTPASSTYVDDPELGQGFILLDEAHRNSFTLEEVSYVDSLLAARGYEMLPFTGGDLAAALRPVNAFLVMTPLDHFNMGEIQAVSNFVQRGGHLMLVGDPTRFNLVFDEEDPATLDFSLETDEIPLNSLANEFDIAFTGDYLYNTTENEGNFRNIILKVAGSSESKLLAGMQRLVFYGSHSLQVGPGGDSLLTTDRNTWSSATDRAGDLIVAATSHEGRVLALGDIHFLIEPYYTVNDNSQFIARIADFLVAPAGREFVLADFPYFYDGPIDLVYAGNPDLGPDAFDEIIALQEAFRQVDQTISLAAMPDPDHATLYLGLYNQAEDLIEILASSGISLTIDPPILTEAEIAAAADEIVEEESTAVAAEPDTATTEAQGRESIQIVQSALGKVQMSGTALILLDEDEGQSRVVVLAASNEGLGNTVSRLLDLIPIDAEYTLADCLLQANLAFCPSNVADETVEAALETGGISEPPAEEEAPEESSAGGETETTSELDAVNQGAIGLGESLQGTLAADEAHLWTFSEGPERVDIVVSSEEIDTVLELYGPDNELIDASDSGFSGDDEQLLDIEIPDEESYSIVVREFFGETGAYTLTVTTANEIGQRQGSIFIFADDDGEPLTSGFTSVESVAAILGEEHQVTTWVSSEDGTLTDVPLAEYDLVVWDSGDYRDEEGIGGEDTATILAYTERGGDLLISGVSPTLLGAADMAPLSDLMVVGEDPVLISGLVAGDVIQLDQTYEAVVGGPGDETLEEGSTVFFLRGPESVESDTIVGVATSAEQKTAVLLAPLVALPGGVQEILLNNLMAWFGLSSS
jgi:hypothetical protein